MSCTNEYFRVQTVWERGKLSIADQCAPVLKGVKAANLIRLPKGIWLPLMITLKASSISCISLYCGRQTEMLYLYRRELLQKTVDQSKNYLKTMGYPDGTLQGQLQFLKKRYEKYFRENGEFPHEIGIFLDYPQEDVKAFVKNQGKNFLFEGYWKVYTNPQEAKRRFCLYDETRKNTVKEYMKCHTIYSLIKR